MFMEDVSGSRMSSRLGFEGKKGRNELSISYLRLDVDSERGKVSLEANGIGCQRTSQVDEAICCGSHAEQLSRSTE